jgi:hypothetical protein
VSGTKEKGRKKATYGRVGLEDLEPVAEEVRVERCVLGVVGLQNRGVEARNLLRFGREVDYLACDKERSAEHGRELARRYPPSYFIFTPFGRGSYSGGKSTPACTSVCHLSKLLFCICSVFHHLKLISSSSSFALPFFGLASSSASPFARFFGAGLTVAFFARQSLGLDAPE